MILWMIFNFGFKVYLFWPKQAARVQSQCLQYLGCITLSSGLMEQILTYFSTTQGQLFAWNVVLLIYSVKKKLRKVTYSIFQHLAWLKFQTAPSKNGNLRNILLRGPELKLDQKKVFPVFWSWFMMNELPRDGKIQLAKGM